MAVQDADAIVVGGGLTGMAAAVVLAKAGFSTLHLAPAGRPDRRTSALMMPSVRFLQAAGLLDAPEKIGHALTEIRIIDATNRLVRAPETVFASREAGHEAFGWNFANARLLEQFQAVAGTLTNLQTRDAAVVDAVLGGEEQRLYLADGSIVSAPLIVGADGKASLVRGKAGFSVREQAFKQAALVCDLQLGRAIGGTSIEFHYAQGPFTLVPAGEKRANLVWIDDAAVLEAARSEGPEHFVAMLMNKSQRLFGEIKALTPSHVFGLSTLGVTSAGRNGVVLVGEAAHAFPPIGAQGLNLGLRDVADLEAVAKAADRSRADWARTVSADYAARRAGDLARTGGMVDTLFRSLLAEMLPAQTVRAGGLWALKLVPELRKQAFAIGMGKL